MSKKDSGKKEVSSEKKSEKGFDKKHKKFRIFVWNSKIHNAFLMVLGMCVILLVAALLVQGMYVKQLEEALIVKSMRSEAFDFEYLVIPMEEFVQTRGLARGTITEMLVYFKENDFSEIYYNVGYVEASTNECNPSGCGVATYRFNQNKGMYVDKYFEKNKLLKGDSK